MMLARYEDNDSKRANPPGAMRYKEVRYEREGKRLII